MRVSRTVEMGERESILELTYPCAHFGNFVVQSIGVGQNKAARRAGDCTVDKVSQSNRGGVRLPSALACNEAAWKDSKCRSTKNQQCSPLRPKAGYNWIYCVSGKHIDRMMVGEAMAEECTRRGVDCTDEA